MSYESDRCWNAGLLEYKLHEGQQLLDEAVKSVKETVVVVHAARGFGKTWWRLVRHCMGCLTKQKQRHVYGAPTREQAKQIILPTMDMVIDDAPRGIKPVWRSADHHYFFPTTGSILVIDGADDEMGDHLRGPFVHEATFDEAAFARHCRYVLKSVLLQQAQRKQGQIFVTTTSPKSIGHEFIGVANEAKLTKSYFKFTIHQNPMLTPETAHKMAVEMADEENKSKPWEDTAVQRELLCEFVTDKKSAVLPEFSRDTHVRNVELPEWYDGWVTIDLGMQDYTHALFAFYDFPNATVVIQDEVVTQSLPVSSIAPLLVAKERELWGEQKPRARISDNHPMEIAEFGRQHILQPELVPRELTFLAANNQNPEALINRARSMFKAGRIAIDPKCTHLIAQCEGGLWNARRTDFERIPALGHLDGIMALVYLLDRLDYSHNPAWRAPMNAETHALYQAKSRSTKEFGALVQLLPASARGKR